MDILQDMAGSMAAAAARALDVRQCAKPVVLLIMECRHLFNLQWVGDSAVKACAVSAGGLGNITLR